MIYWKAYNKNDAESYKNIWSLLKSGWHGGEILEQIESENGDVYLVRKNLDVLDVRHGDNYDKERETEIKNNL